LGYILPETNIFNGILPRRGFLRGSELAWWKSGRLVPSSHNLKPEIKRVLKILRQLFKRFSEHGILLHDSAVIRDRERQSSEIDCRSRFSLFSLSRENVIVQYFYACL
jgi:hypothetical protein